MSLNFHRIIDGNFIENPPSFDYWELCDKFVKETCQGRDESHGYNHMLRVAKNALYILKYEADHKLIDDEITKMSIIGAWLHDVADSKYDNNNYFENLVKEFLNTNFPDIGERIINAIYYSSYSKEQNIRKMDVNFNIYWELLFPNKKDILVRHIISDADKLEALGFFGIIRCFNYAYGKLQYEEYDAGVHLIDHANYKFGTLREHYIHTKTAKCLAKPLHDELWVIINCIKQNAI